MTTGEYDNGGVLRWRLDRYGERLDKLEEWRPKVQTDLDVGEAFQREIREDLKILTEKVDAIQARSTTILVSIVTGCVGLMLTILAGTGKI